MITAVVVDDSRMMRVLIEKALTEEGDIEVVGSAADPYEAREMIRANDPDVITLDVEMPRMDGLEFLRRIMDLRPMPVVMVSTLTKAGAETTLTALEIGAIDFAAKPASNTEWGHFSTSLRQKVRIAAKVKFSHLARLKKPVAAATVATAATVASKPALNGWPSCSLIAIGASTGGVAAINQLISGLPEMLPPLVISQHMPSGFTARFANRMARMTGRNVSEAIDGEILQDGFIRLAPGDQHLRISRSAGQLITNLGGDPPINNYRPSVDALFASVADACGNRATGLILTGMGGDGAEGLLQMRNAGAKTCGQSEVSCTVYGMPKVAMQLGAVADEFSIDEMATHLSRHFASRECAPQARRKLS